MVEQVGLSLFPHNSKFGWLFMEIRGGSLQGSQQSSPWGSPQSRGQWVVCRAGVSLFNSPISAFLHGGKVTFLDRPPLQEGLQRVRMGGGGKVEKGL